MSVWGRVESAVVLRGTEHQQMLKLGENLAVLCSSGSSRLPTEAEVVKEHVRPWTFTSLPAVFSNGGRSSPSHTATATTFTLVLWYTFNAVLFIY